MRVFSICFGLIAAALLSKAETQPVASAASANPLVWDALAKSADLPAMTNTVLFTFWVTNTSLQDATILSTETSCDCTVAEAAEKLPWQIAPGSNGWMNVRVNTKGKFGSLEKSVAVRSSSGTQVLTIRVKIPLSPAPFNVSVRQQDMMAAKADRQAVFKDHCAACHSWPAAHQTGEVLFEKACGICHISAHRAEMVPDLFAIKRPTDAAFWRELITHGKAGSLMPAFALSEGGILDTNQIESLVEYAVKRFPSKFPPPPDPSDYLFKRN
jgi:mono/diheme cytochrome c family protein